LDPRPQPNILWLERTLDVNSGLYIGVGFLATGGLIFLTILLTWISRSFGDLQAIRPAILGLTFVFLGLQIGFSSFLWGLFQIQRLPPSGDPPSHSS
ncbi:MAG TPA: hypothetical protein PKO06_20115, partial [Candidatus Ozemobacteraceae bacterium]|nr:hypothetical protein [Candidatus Ozemobacteraceae bacterium]